MDDDDQPWDVFAAPNFWAKPQIWNDLLEPHSLLFKPPEILEDEGFASGFASTQPNHGFFKNLSFSLGAPSEPYTTSSTPSEVEARDEVAIPSGAASKPTLDVWTSSQTQPVKRADLLSWDAFENGHPKEFASAYITEAGHAAVDALLADPIDVLQIGETKHTIVKAETYADSLLSLGLGRSSILFTWSEEKKIFLQEIENIRITGFSGGTTSGFLKTFMTCGNKTRVLQELSERIYTTPPSAGKVALADSISTLLSLLKERLGQTKFERRSFLQLQAAFKPAESLLVGFGDLVDRVSSAKTDEAMLSGLFDEMQRLEYQTDSMTEILLELMSRVSLPFLDFVGEWVGLQPESGIRLDKNGIGRSFVKVEDKSWIDEQGFERQEPDYTLDVTKLPSFLALDDSKMMFETGKSLRFLRTHHSEHPLSRDDIIAKSGPPSLEWNFTWQDVEKVQVKAQKYERDLMETLNLFSGESHNSIPDIEKPEEEKINSEIHIFNMSSEELEAHFFSSAMTLSERIPRMVPTDQLSVRLERALLQTNSAQNDEIFAPPICLTPLMSFGPILRAQARMVNRATMQLFFKSHYLREHLNIQRRFHLMGDGVFSSRLSHALFDPELETAKRQAGIARTGGVMGLGLEARDTWPPATSELRLALMGILTESYSSTLPPAKLSQYFATSTELPGDLSFAVRELSPEEIEKCIDPNSVEALDFLRLSYKPPAPLEAVITPMALHKYDQIFKLLLRVIRMLYVVSQLFRDATDRTSFWRGIDTTAQRFRIEAHHLITCVCSYFFDTGIEMTWSIFEKKLDEIEKRNEGGENHALLDEVEGLDKLRAFHERVLDRIMFSLLLRKRQAAVMKLLEEIFGLILQFSKHSRSRAMGLTKKVGQDDDVKIMYVRFKRKVEVFITVCRGLSEGKGYGEKEVSEQSIAGGGGLLDIGELRDENTIVQLLSKLEMSGYYSQPSSKRSHG